MSKNSYTGKDFVYAILAYLNERQYECITFEPSTYGDESDIPFCKKLNGRVETVEPSDKPGSIKLTVVRTDADGQDYTASTSFNGHEDEDFDFLFHEVYYYFADGDADEAEEWMEKTVIRHPNREDFEKEYLIMKVRQSVKRIGKDFAVPYGITCKFFPGEDTEIIMNILTVNTEVKVVATNAHYSCICATLDKFSLDDLKKNYQYLIATEINNYNEAKLYFDETDYETDVDRAFIAYLKNEKERLESIIRGPKWDFVYEEEFHDSNGANRIGIIQNKNNPKQVLFFQVYAYDKDDIETCHILTSITLDYATHVCEYPWTAENEEMLLDCLNNTIVGEEYAETNGPLAKIGFKSVTGKKMVF